MWFGLMEAEWYWPQTAVVVAGVLSLVGWLVLDRAPKAR
jgi:hypothetical protein